MEKERKRRPMTTAERLEWRVSAMEGMEAVEVNKSSSRSASTSRERIHRLRLCGAGGGRLRLFLLAYLGRFRHFARRGAVGGGIFRNEPDFGVRLLG